MPVMFKKFKQHISSESSDLFKIMGFIRSIALIFFLLFFISTQKCMLSFGMNIICKENERTALLSFRQHIKDPTSSLSSWSGQNCCRWIGVRCNNRTDHVVQLQLQNLGLGGELNPSLRELKQLRHLDLSGNDFEGISIPDFLGSLRSLRYLNLSSTGFGGMIPHQLGNLSNLRYLDISSNSGYQLFVGNFQWISHLSSLEHLDLSNGNLENASGWFHAVNMLPSLLVLRLSDCYLSGAFPSLPYINLRSLAVLDLSSNYNLNSTLPEWLYSLTNLEQLDLHGNSFQGKISTSVGNLTKLTILDLSHNQLESEIPMALGNLSKLQRLDLSYNKLSGPLPDQLGRLQNLDYLDLRNNIFSGSIPFSIGRLTLLSYLDRFNELNGHVPESIGNLLKLEKLYLSHNPLEGGIVSDVVLSNLTRLRTLELDSVVLNVSSEWIPPFQLINAKLRNCGLGPLFPNWIQTQKLLWELDLSGNGLSGNVPTWFWNLSSQFFYLNLSHNQFNGELPKVLKSSVYGGIFLSSNQFKGPLPHLAPGIVALDLSNNFFSGHISALLCNPSSTEMNQLELLDLSNNLLSGNLSQCWFNWTTLHVLRLENNNITGKIQSSMGSLLELRSLSLQNNYLSGELPVSLRNCTNLMAVDIGENALTGSLPLWLGESFQNLIILRLRQNKFHGKIPQEFCGMTSLQMLDIAHNNLSGFIPRCFNNLSAMVTKQNKSAQISFSFIAGDFVETTSLVTKGREVEYSKTLRLVTNMDLSNNNLSGEIPEELTSLIGLRFLTLSKNRFTGKIPEKISNMVLLESLDLSYNNISGVIPQSISGLSFLSHLNLSLNNLSGKIPLGTQLQGFNESSFIGNQELCGSPLKNCNQVKPPQKPGDGDKEVEDEVWFYISMGVGFAVGLWTFCGVMVLKRSWRISYFRFLDDMKDKLCQLL